MMRETMIEASILSAATGAFPSSNEVRTIVVDFLRMQSGFR
jgi:hypothetical protein